MAERGWLRASEPARVNDARMYRLTPRGREVLTRVRAALDELYREVGERRSTPPATAGTRHSRR